MCSSTTSSATSSATSPNALGTTVQGANVGGRGIPNFTEAALPATLVANPQAGQNTIPADLKNPQTYVWNFGIQRELPGHNVLDIAYVGTRGTRLFINEQLNPGVPGSTNPNGRLFATRGSVISRTNGGDSQYHGLQMRLERSFRDHFLYRATYTFQKTIDNTNSEIFATTGGNSVGSDPFNRTSIVGVADFDVPHIFTLSGLWDIPGSRIGLLEGSDGRIPTRDDLALPVRKRLVAVCHRHRLEWRSQWHERSAVDLESVSAGNVGWFREFAGRESGMRRVRRPGSSTSTAIRLLSAMSVIWSILRFVRDRGTQHFARSGLQHVRHEPATVVQDPVHSMGRGSF